MKTFLSTDLNIFTKEIIWFKQADETLKDKDYFLGFLMAKSPYTAYEHAEKYFYFTDNDFINALKNAHPGIFMYEQHWLKWNERLNINPPLPFPKKYI